MATTPSAAAADDVHGPLEARMEAKINIKICWNWMEIARGRAREEEKAHLVDLLVAESSGGGEGCRGRICH
jgi:hypothetical protein